MCTLKNYRSVLTSIIGTISATNVVRVIMANRENWISVAKYVEHILGLKKRNLEAAEQGTGNWTYMSPLLSTRNPNADIGTRGERAKRTPLRSNNTVVPKWAQQVHETRRGFSG